MVQGTGETLRAHPRGGLRKGAQTAHPKDRERGEDEVTEGGRGDRKVRDPAAVGVQVPRQDNHSSRGEEEVRVYPIQDFLEGVEVPVGGEIHVGVAVGHASHGEVCDEGSSRRVGAVAGHDQVRGPIEESGTSPSHSCWCLDGVVQGVHPLDDQGSRFLHMQG